MRPRENTAGISGTRRAENNLAVTGGDVAWHGEGTTPRQDNQFNVGQEAVADAADTRSWTKLRRRNGRDASEHGLADEDMAERRESGGSSHRRGQAAGLKVKQIQEEGWPLVETRRGGQNEEGRVGWGLLPTLGCSPWRVDEAQISGSIQLDFAAFLPSLQFLLIFRLNISLNLS